MLVVFLVSWLVCVVVLSLDVFVCADWFGSWEVFRSCKNPDVRFSFCEFCGVFLWLACVRVVALVSSESVGGRG